MRYFLHIYAYLLYTAHILIFCNKESYFLLAYLCLQRYSIDCVSAACEYNNETLRLRYHNYRSFHRKGT